MSAPAAAHETPLAHAETVIAPEGSTGGAVRELWTYRELVFFLIWRDLKVRYKQTALGVTWVVLQPVFTMVVFSVFFGRLASVPSDGVPYPLFAFAALVPWTFFSYGLTQAANSVVMSQHLITKVYFPRLAIPVATVVAGLVDLLLAFIVLLGMMAWYGRWPTLNVVWLPLFILLAIVTCLGVGILFAALNVEFRDVRYIVPFVAQFWLLATPIAYPSSLLSQPWRTVYALNPMVGVVEGFRWALLGTATRPGPIIVASASAALGLLLVGVLYFRRMERTFADVI